MQGQYPGNRGARLRDACQAVRHEVRSARLFLCAACRTQSLICSCCDRGQIYCAGDCAARARHRAMRAAGRRYQSSRRGRLAHADRTRRYRARGKKVTHHGSPEPPGDDLLALGSPTIAGDAAIPEERPGAASHCHWCGRRCPAFVRREFLRRRLGRRDLMRYDRTGPEHGHAA
ncbi:MAG TPA: hypothetical protein VID96_00925 [Xanthobacteraceae bacterium]|jgi:hypothetical protein